MTTQLWVFICTKTTADVVIPKFARTQEEYNRRVSGGFQAFAGGHTRAGDLLLRPTTNAVSNHLLCDGSTLNILQFPELYNAIGTAFGGDGITTFQLPDYGSQALTVPGITVTQTVDPSGTVSTGGTVTTPTGPGQTGGSSGGNVVSGGREPKNVNERPV